MSAWNNKYVTLVRRELWEHKSLWMAPAIVGACMVLMPLFGGEMRFGPRAETISNQGGSVTVLTNLFGQATMVGVTIIMGIIACLAAVLYLLDTLYAERKDRSILFWKSLPVSDAETVLAKLAIAMVATPLIALLLSALFMPLMTASFYLRSEQARMVIDGGTLLGGLGLLPKVALLWLYGVLWYAPLFSVLMLASVLARRVPLMYAVMPPLALVLLEGMLMGGNSVARFLGQRIFPWTSADWVWDGNPRDGQVMGGPDWGRLFSDPDLWIGVAVAAAIVFLVIRLRRYRDDT